VPKIQILTVKELLAGKNPRVTDLSRSGETVKTAPKEEKAAAQIRLF
jgi:hypothetical protein